MTQSGRSADALPDTFSSPFNRKISVPDSDLKMTAFDTDKFQKASWLREAPTTSGLRPSSNKDLTLHVDSLRCDRKNEISSDEIRLLGFWSTRDGATSGFVLKDFAFAQAGESQDAHLSIELANFASDQILFVVLYEEDHPPIDPNDSIGLIAIFPDLSVNAFAGDLGKPSEPESARYLSPKPLTISLDAGRDGQYSFVVRVDS
jgi:hypothetical protein